MIDRLPAVLSSPGPIRLLAAYHSAGSLLRELSRALNQGQTLLKADSGLPAGMNRIIIYTPARTGEMAVAARDRYSCGNTLKGCL
jgi:hypothetical protein